MKTDATAKNSIKNIKLPNDLVLLMLGINISNKLGNYFIKVKVLYLEIGIQGRRDKFFIEFVGITLYVILF